MYLKKNLKASRPSEHPSVRGKMSKRFLNCVFVLHSTAPLTTEHEGVSACTARMYSSSTFSGQNPALEIVHQQKSVKVYLHINMDNGNVQQKQPIMAIEDRLFYRG